MVTTWAIVPLVKHPSVTGGASVALIGAVVVASTSPASLGVFLVLVDLVLQHSLEHLS